MHEGPAKTNKREIAAQTRAARALAPAALLLALAGCASQVPEVVAGSAGTPGFWWGLWHGFIFPFAWIGSLFSDEIAVYAVPNSGGWYDFGFFLDITVLGGGSWFSHRRRRQG